MKSFETYNSEMRWAAVSKNDKMDTNRTGCWTLLIANGALIHSNSST